MERGKYVPLIYTTTVANHTQSTISRQCSLSLVHVVRQPFSRACRELYWNGDYIRKEMICFLNVCVCVRTLMKYVQGSGYIPHDTGVPEYCFFDTSRLFIYYNCTTPTLPTGGSLPLSPPSIRLNSSNYTKLITRNGRDPPPPPCLIHSLPCSTIKYH